MNKVLLVFFITCCSINLIYSQQYEEKWQKVDSLEIATKTASAEKLVQEILLSAEKKEDYINYLKARIYHFKFYQINHEDSNSYILKEIDQDLSKLPFPFQNILYSYKAEIFNDYFQNNRWETSERKKIDNPAVYQIETWDQETLQDSIQNSFRKSLQQPQQLVKIPVEIGREILNQNNLYRDLRPSLFDLLAYNAINFYSNSSNCASKFDKETIDLTSPLFFDVSGRFLSYQFTPNLQEDRLSRTLAIFQLLEKFHIGNNLPYVHAILARLHFLQSKNNTPEQWENYLNSLLDLKERFDQKNVVGYIDLELAEGYYFQAQKRNEEDSLLYPDYHQKAEEIAQSLRSNYPNTSLDQKAARLIATINQKTFYGIAQERILPNTPSRLLVNYANTDSVRLKIFRVKYNFEIFRYRKNIDSILAVKFATKTRFDSTYVLKQTEDHNIHSTEIALPKLKTGSYFIIAQTRDVYGNFGYDYFSTVVSNLAYSVLNLDDVTKIKVLNATTGEPLANVGVKDNYLANARQSSQQGDLTLNNINNWKDYKGYLFYNGDTLAGKFRNYTNRYNRNKKSVSVKIPIYLDRAIYRPGQTVYFKGILLKNEDDKTTVVANEHVNVIVEDPNGNEIKNFSLKTNDYGSFNEKFILPSSGLTGKFQIYAEEGTENSQFWNQIETPGIFQNENQTFSVEEYKRPTFEVVFQQPDTTFSLHETVTLQGNANSYLGSSISNAKVTYSVTRKKEIRGWWRNYFEDETVIVQDSTATNAHGIFHISFKTDINRKDATNESLMYIYEINAAVTDISGETHTSNFSLKVGKVQLILNMEAATKVNSGENLHLLLKSANLNNNPVSTPVTLKVYKIRIPENIQKNRIWESPEIPGFTEEEFHRLFPNEPFISKPENVAPELGELVWEKDFEIDGEKELDINFSKKWNSGRYLLQLNSRKNKNAQVTNEVSLVDPKDKYLADNEELETSIIPSEKNVEMVSLDIRTAYKDLWVQVLVYDGKNEILRDMIKIDGHTSIPIPTQDLENDKINIIVSGVRNNSEISSVLDYQVPKKVNRLHIKTSTFRNKLEPGSEETWSFKIDQKEGEMQGAEVLASMYDASLDQFTTSNWDSNNLFGKNYTYSPRLSVPGIEQTTRFGSSYNSYRYFPQKRNFDELNFFGFQFSLINSWQYRKYLERLKFLKDHKSENGNYSGVVTDDYGLPLPGVNVIIEGASTVAQTDFDGQFFLDYKKGDILVFSYVGMRTQRIIITDQEKLYVFMDEDVAQLDEVVAVGYGTELKEEALAGSVSGLLIQSDTSENIVIKGTSSLTASTNALFIIDGKPSTEGISTIKPEDILTIEVLETDAAVALYGEKGKNGVVLITTKKGERMLSQVQVRKNMDETAFFFPELRTDEQGNISFNFTTPEALTRWKLRLLAHTKNWTTGNFIEKLVTQKELSITPNAPRFLREKDSILIKVKIANLTEDKMTGIASLKLFNALTMQPVNAEVLTNAEIKNFVVNSKENSTVSWKLYIPKGIPAITYRISANSANFSDGEENTLPVLTNRMLVYESIPLFTRAGEERNFAIKNLVENESKSLENHLLSIEYSSNPAWYAVQSLPYLMNYEHQCSEQIFSRLFSNGIARHIVESQPQIKKVFQQWQKDSSLVSSLEKNEELKSLLLNETPWVQDAATEKAKKQRLGILFDENKLVREESDNLNKLEWMQFPGGAFPWFKGGEANPFLTRHILAGLGHLNKLGVQLPSNNIAKLAISFLDAEFISSYNKRSNPESASYNVQDLHYLYARSFYLKEYPLPSKNREIANNIIIRVKTDSNLNIYSQALRVLVLNRMNETTFAQDFLEGLKEKAVKSDTYGMFWKENTSGWRWYQNPVETQALLIEAFEEVGNYHVSDELKIWLLQQKRINNWPSTKATSEACYALLLRGDNWLSVSENTTIKLGGKEIAESKWEEAGPEAGTGYVKFNWQLAEFSPEEGNITIINNSDHPGFGGGYWQYFEDLDNIKVQDSMPLQVKKELYLNVPGNTGNQLKSISPSTPLKIGDLVTVRLVITSEIEMDFIHLKDMRASGFEPVNVLSEYKYQDGLGYYESTKDAATHFFFDNLPKGNYVLEYTVRANNAGDFSNGITTIESMYAPEFSSHTKGIRVDISE